MGIVTFARDARVIFGFEKYFNIWTMLKVIDNIKFSQRGTFTGKGLDVVRNQLFDTSARQGVPRILLVVTDSASQVSFKNEQNHLLCNQYKRRKHYLCEMTSFAYCNRLLSLLNGLNYNTL